MQYTQDADDSYLIDGRGHTDDSIQVDSSFYALAKYRPIKNFFYHAGKIAPWYGKPLLKTLKGVCDQANRNWPSIYMGDVRSIDNFRTDTYDPNVYSWNTDYFCLWLAHGLDAYVQAKINNGEYNLEARTGRPLVRYLFDICVIY